MNSVIEIEKAIERLPELEQRKLADWFGEHRLIVEASAMLSELYDEEEGGGKNESLVRPLRFKSRMAVERAVEDVWEDR